MTIIVLAPHVVPDTNAYEKYGASVGCIRADELRGACAPSAAYVLKSIL